MSLATSLSLVGGERIAIAGDSITAANMYSNYLIAWFHLQYPTLDLHVQSLARSGTSSSGWATSDTTPPAESQYERFVYPFDPDVVFLMLGHNDGSDVGAQSTNTQGIIDTWIEGTSAAIPVLCGAHPSETTDGKPVIGQFNDNYETIAIAATPDYLFSHTWNELVSEWIASFNDAESLVQGANAVHPGAAGHILIAYAILKELAVVSGENMVSSATIDSTGPTETASTDCTLTSITSNAYSGVDFNRLDARLPWAIDESGRANAVGLLGEVANWQDYLLSVTNLASGTYEIYIDSVLVATKLHSELSTGVNLSDMTSGPVWDQVQDVLGTVRDMQGIDRTTLARLGPPFSGVEKYGSQATASYQNGDERGATYHTTQVANVAAIDTLDGLIHTAATPATMAWSVRKVGGGTGSGTVSAKVSRRKVRSEF
jgi:lysophospholipase L1-like esterase